MAEQTQTAHGTGQGLDYVEILAAEGAAFIAAVAAGPADAPIAACPGWDLTKLAAHLATTWSWSAKLVAERLTEPVAPEPVEFEPGEAAAQLETRLVRLMDALRSCPPDTPVWHFGPHPRTADFWARRQAHETLVHRIDAEIAVGKLAPISDVVASDAVAEFLDVMLPRMYYKQPPPPGALQLTATDTGGSWTHGDPAGGIGTLTGRAEDLLFVLWGRGHDDAVQAGGDLDVLSRWRALGAP